jgi:HlyD family secretion protein
MKDTRKRQRSAVRGILRTLKWLVPLAFVGGLVALAFAPKPVEVDAGSVTRNAMMLTIDDDGMTRIRERYTISAPLGGRLVRIALDPGDEVKKGDLLATINPGLPDLLDPRAIAQAEAMVNAAEATLTRAESQFQAAVVDTAQLEKPFRRNEGLRDKGNIADAVLEESERRYLAAQHAETAANSAVEIARFELAQAQAALLHATGRENTETPEADDWNLGVHSPIDGRVMAVHEESSRVVPAGAALLEIGDPGALEMRIDVLSEQAVKIAPGQKVLVEHWGGEAPLTGRVRLVEPAAFTKVSALGVDEQRVYVLADFDELPSAIEALGHAFRIEARIVIWEHDDVLQVPAGALFPRDNQWAVYRIEAGHARLALIELGRNNGEVAEVLSGLSAGDRVILHPGDRVEEETLVRPRP